MNEGMWLRVGAVWGLVAVGIGAFGAHGLKEMLEASGKAESFRTGTDYHMYMAFAIVAVGLARLSGRGGAALDAAGWLFLVGSVCFSGSIYGLCLAGWRWLIPVTPIGGLLIMIGWAALAVAAGSGSKAASVETAAQAVAATTPEF